jgi:hypothetical protein
MEKETGKRCETDILTWRGMLTKVGGCKLMVTLGNTDPVYRY